MSRSRQDWTFDGLDAEPPSQAGRLNTRGLTADDMDVAFQPIVDLQSGLLFGAEALARCRVPLFRNPTVLFAQAVRDHAAGHLGRVIRDVAFARCQRIPLFINLHPAELNSRWLVRPDDPLNFYDGELYLEVTEAAAFDHFELCRGALRELCARTGAHLVIDDFGAGYSNLKRMIELEPDVVKLDRELVTGIDRSPRQRELVRHVVALCHALGARVVAEGIETEAELRQIRESRADFGQGYLLARPAFPIPEVNWPDLAASRHAPGPPPPPPRLHKPAVPHPRRASPSASDLPAPVNRTEKAGRKG